MIVVVASAIIQKDNAVLFIRETKPAAEGKYGLPGGKLEDGETLEACVIREAKEETGLTIRAKKLVAVTHKPNTHEGNNVIRFIYNAVIASETQTDHEMELSWLTADEIISLAEQGLIRGKDVATLTVQHLHEELIALPKPKLFD